MKGSFIRMEQYTPSIPQKQCSRCKRHKPATTEFFHRKRKTSLASWCKQCTAEYAREKRGTPPPPPDGMKRCRVCKTIKPATTEFFERGIGMQRKRESICLQCQERIAAESRQASQGSLRQCSVCKEWKPATAEFFNRRKSRKSGFQSSCRDCCIKYKQMHAEERAQYNIMYYGSHKEEREKYYETHREQIRTYRRKRYEANREKTIEQSRQYRKEHKDRISEYKKQYLKTHRDQISVLHHKRRAIKRQAGGSFSAQDIQRQRKAQKGKCYYCKAKLVVYHIEHIVPLSRGGTNDIWNIVLSCPPCNASKHSKLLHEWPEGGRLC